MKKLYQEVGTNGYGNRLGRWWRRRSRGEKIAICAGGAVVVGALSYAIATGGILIVTKGGTVVAAGKAASTLATALA